jgi:UDP-3-O-[3-hydroxymyristoyl] glucosamine N-acyltransferase
MAGKRPKWRGNANFIEKGSSMNPKSLQYFADKVRGTVHGNGDVLCYNALPLWDAQTGTITLLDNPKNFEVLLKANVAAVVVRKILEECEIPQLVVDSPHESFAEIVSHFRPQSTLTGSGVSSAAQVDPTASIGSGTIIHPNVTLGANVVIGENCVIMPGTVILDRCRLGDSVMLFPNVVIYPDTIVEDRVLIHAGSVIGAYGFGYQICEGKHIRAAQLGYVHIESDVEVGACATIDRGTFGPTRIGTGTKMDNHVMIAHNCRIGRHNLICSQVGIAGSSSTGDYCVLAGQVGIADHVKLGDQVTVGAQAGVMSDLASKGTYLGSPAMPFKEQMLLFAIMRKLPMISRTVRKLEHLINGDSESRRDAA